jgi:hypothetical protein
VIVVAPVAALVVAFGLVDLLLLRAEIRARG